MSPTTLPTSPRTAHPAPAPGPPWLRRHAPEVALALGFVALNAALLANGIRDGGDTGRYLDGAAKLLAGEPLTGRQTTFAGYAALVALSQAVGAGLAGVVAVQVAFAALASAALYDLGSRLGGRAAGWLAAAFHALNPDFARWNGVILTDSLYASLVVLAAWAVHRAAGRGGGAYALAALLLACAALVRPNGWFLPPVALAYWIARARLPRRTRLALLGGLAAAGVAAVFALAGRRGAMSDIRTYEELRQGTVVWGDRPRHMRMPGDAGPATGGPREMAAYALRHPVATTRLVTTRIGVELVHTRPFYSAAHNLVVIALLFPVYAFAVLGLARLRDRPEVRLLIAVVAVHLAIVGASFADWDGRFLLHFLALVGVLAAWGAAPLIDRMAGRRHRRI